MMPESGEHDDALGRRPAPHEVDRDKVRHDGLEILAERLPEFAIEKRVEIGRSGPAFP
jgi:hypothetical protein